MLDRIVALGRRNPGWWQDPEKVADLAAAWGARVNQHGLMLVFEAEEVARLGPDGHASILIARTASGLFAAGIAARWGDGTGVTATVHAIGQAVPAAERTVWYWIAGWKFIPRWQRGSGR